MKIRKANKQDIHRCLDIECPETGEDRSILKRNFMRELNDDRYVILVAEINCEIVGFIDGRKEAWNKSFSIEQLYIDKKQRGKGYGSALLAEVIKRAKESRVRILFVDLPPQNKRALKFYMRHGFHEAGYINDFYNDTKKPHAVILSLKI